MPRVHAILETSLYVEDLTAAIDFYGRVLGLPVVAKDGRFCAFRAGEMHVLLLFKRGESSRPMPVEGGVIPPHDGSGSNHAAFAIGAEEMPDWEQRLAEYGVEVEGRVDWSGGSRSLYFRDPSGNLLELVTPGLWGIQW